MRTVSGMSPARLALVAAMLSASTGQAPPVPVKQNDTNEHGSLRESRGYRKPYVKKEGQSRVDIARRERAEAKRARKAARRLAAVSSLEGDGNG